MKVLVIHPKDITTDFLITAYNQDFTIVRTELSNSTLKSLIKQHDVIVMMGHGDRYGLYGHGRYIIDSSDVAELRNKICICVWCYAYKFVEKYGLNSPFCTDMFISEEEEADFEGIDLLKDKYPNLLYASNIAFAMALQYGFMDMIHKEDGMEEMINTIGNYYDNNLFDSPLKQYNLERFHSHEIQKN